ncbi:GTPase domain-containing protein [Trichocoleus sp. DQ-U1]|uniref:GTPase domain-containing protein n=1 Tax=Trichocoleus sp. DQ-U1 TaxID=2933926 RepID=UPI003297365F
MTIKIAVAGHTNVGKTTLIRTLMRLNVGEVGDAPNITKKGKLYYYDGLQATFIDTPGFVYPSIAINYLNREILSKVDQEKMALDLDAIKSIEQSDIVIYLVNLSVTYDGGYKDEMEIVRRVQPKTIAILNQYYQNLQGIGYEKVENRCRQWKEILNKQGVNKTIVFDAHWDRRSKEKEIYDAIYETLRINKKEDFVEGLKRFKERQNKIREEVCEALSDSVENLQKIRVNVKKSEYNGDQKGECRDKILRVINKETVQFIAYVSKLYEVAAEYPTDSAEDLILKAHDRISFSGRLGMTTSVSTVLGTVGAVVGGIVGAVITGYLSGGLATIAGAVEGAKIFGGFGAALGSFAVFSDIDDRVDVRMTSAQIEDVVKDLLAIVWGLEHNGFGRGKNLSEDEAKAMKSQIKELHAQQKIDDWTKVNRGRVINYCKDNLKELENY